MDMDTVEVDVQQCDPDVDFSQGGRGSLDQTLAQLRKMGEERLGEVMLPAQSLKVLNGSMAVPVPMSSLISASSHGMPGW